MKTAGVGKPGTGFEIPHLPITGTNGTVVAGFRSLSPVFQPAPAGVEPAPIFLLRGRPQAGVQLSPVFQQTNRRRGLLGFLDTL